MNTIKLIADYWSQITLILVGVGYFIKRVYDYKSKKLEINYTLFQQQKITAISNFLEAYSKTEWMFNELSFSKVITHEYEAEEIDKIIFPPLTELRKATLEVELYFEEDISKYFKIILTEFYSLNRQIMEMWKEIAPEKGVIQRSNELELSHLSKVRIVEANLKIITEKIKHLYKH